MKQKVKIMVDGRSNEVEVEADTHKSAVAKLYKEFEAKNQAGKMMSEQIKIFGEGGFIDEVVNNVLCS